MLKLPCQPLIAGGLARGEHWTQGCGVSQPHEYCFLHQTCAPTESMHAPNIGPRGYADCCELVTGRTELLLGTTAGLACSDLNLLTSCCVYFLRLRCRALLALFRVISMPR